MSPALLGFVCGAAWFGVFLVGHVAVLALQEKPAPASTMIRTFVVAMLGAGITTAIFTHAGWAGLLLAETYSLLVMACLFVVYAPFFFTVYTSLSVESLLIARRLGGSVPLATLYRRFASMDFIAGRLATMVASGYLVLTGDRYRPSSKGLIVAAVFAGIKRLLRLGPGG